MLEVILAAVGENEPVADPKIKWCGSQIPSRGLQMNCGSREAAGEILLFHHVDSELTAPHLEAIVAKMRDPTFVGGAFYREFDERHPFLRWLEKPERWHTRAFGTIYGDQSVFVRREIFSRLGGFASLPLMEDVEFSKRLRRAGKIALLDPPMHSSPERQIEQGSSRVTWRNLFFLIAYRFGVTPERLHAWYYAETKNEMKPVVVPKRKPEVTSHESTLEKTLAGFPSSDR